MRQDFRQERKLKLTIAYQLAKWVMDWHLAMDKIALRVKVRPPRFLEAPMSSAPIIDIEMKVAESNEAPMSIENQSLEMAMDIDPPLLESKVDVVSTDNAVVPAADPVANKVTHSEPELREFIFVDTLCPTAGSIVMNSSIMNDEKLYQPFSRDDFVPQIGSIIPINKFMTQKFRFGESKSSKRAFDESTLKFESKFYTF